MAGREGFHERVLEAAQSATVVVDRSGTITFVSRASEDVLGYAPDDLVGRNLADVVDPADLDETVQAFGAVRDRGHRWPPAVFRLRGPDGTTVPVQVSGHGLFDDPLVGGAVYSVHRVDESVHLHHILAALATGEPLGETLRHVTEMVAVPPLELDVAVLHDLDDDRFRSLASAVDLPPAVGRALVDPPADAPWSAPIAAAASRDDPVLTRWDELAPAVRALLGDRYVEVWTVPVAPDRLGPVAVVVALARATALPGTAIRQRLRRARDVCELAFIRRTHEEQLRHEALHDGLTKIPNRARFFDALEHGVGQRGGPLTGVLYLDLDGFKPLNDAHGHGFGDRVLVEVASRIDGALRPHDLAARLGGDEFAVLIEDIADPEEAESLARGVLAAVSAPLEVGGVATSVGVSIGVAVGSSAGDRSRLLHAADQAMYEAKRAGAGTIRTVTV